MKAILKITIVLFLITIGLLWTYAENTSNEEVLLSSEGCWHTWEYEIISSTSVQYTESIAKSSIYDLDCKYANFTISVNDSDSLHHFDEKPTSILLSLIHYTNPKYYARIDDKVYYRWYEIQNVDAESFTYVHDSQLAYYKDKNSVFKRGEKFPGDSTSFHVSKYYPNQTPVDNQNIYGKDGEILSFVTDDEIANADMVNYLSNSARYIEPQNSIENYRLEDNITRQEVLKILLKRKYFRKYIEWDYECKWIFQDMQDWWGCKYIETALSEWIISQNTYFEPNNNITKGEVLKLIINEKWIKDTSINPSNWQWKYIQTAINEHIIGEAFFDYNGPATRQWIFKIIARPHFTWKLNK